MFRACFLCLVISPAAALRLFKSGDTETEDFLLHGNTLGAAAQGLGDAGNKATAGGNASWPDKWMIALEHGQSIAHALDMDTLFKLVHAKSGPVASSYQAQTIAIPDFNIPALKAQHAVPGWDARNDDEIKRTTRFPSYLALASSWDKGLVYDVAMAVSEEFKALGANAMMGPALNIHRATQHDQDFDSLAGEDPTLGSILVRSWMLATSTHGIMSIPKYIGKTEQNMAHPDKGTSKLTAWDVFYPPFETAIDCGAVGIMCASHEVNGLWSCRDKEMLDKDLKGTMGFQGMVMSDVASAKELFKFASAFEEGLDLMLDEPEVIPVTDHLVKGMRKAATRVIASIWKMRLEDDPGCQPPNCGADLAKTVTTPEHQAVALQASGSAIVLLQNHQETLPLEKDKVNVISVVGPGAKKYLGLNGPAPTTWHLLRKVGYENGIEVTDNMDGTDGMDVCVIIATADEKKHWDLDEESQKTLDQAIGWCKKIVVLLELSGTILTPWRDSVRSIASVFHKGPETAMGWATMLFGASSPSGKLPISFPVVAQDTPEWWTEPAPSYWDFGILAFPFGHGMSYATFSYGEIKRKPGCRFPVCMMIDVTNSHPKRSGSEVVQVYFKFPDSTRHPKVLRGFYKTKVLAPGEKEKVFFPFTLRDISLYRETGNGTVSEKSWVPQDEITLLVGASSHDIRKSLTVRPKFT